MSRHSSMCLWGDLCWICLWRDDCIFCQAAWGMLCSTCLCCSEFGLADKTMARSMEDLRIALRPGGSQAYRCTWAQALESQAFVSNQKGPGASVWLQDSQPGFGSYFPSRNSWLAIVFLVAILSIWLTVNQNSTGTGKKSNRCTLQECPTCSSCDSHH